MNLAATILRALLAAWNVWRSERDLHNKPEMVKEKTAQAIQEAKDRLTAAEIILADPKASQKDHEEALRQIRLSHS